MSTIVKLTLPSTKDLAESQRVLVEFETAVFPTELDQNLPIGRAEEKLVSTENAIDTAVRHIISWNLEDESGPAPISRENVGQIQLNDIAYLLAHLKLRKELNRTQTGKVVVAMDNQMGGSNAGANKIPLSMQLYLYRQAHHTSWYEMSRTPYSVILQDMQYAEIIQQLRNKHNTHA